MGRVARYKKAKACDFFSKANRGGKNQSLGSHEDIGFVRLDGIGNQRRKRLETKVARRKYMQKKLKNGKINIKDAFDAPPDEEDDFDMATLFKVKKQESIPNVLRLDNDRNDVQYISASQKPQNTNSVGSNQKEGNLIKKEQDNNVLTCSIPRTNEDEKNNARILNDKKHATASSSTDQKAKLEGRREGETMKAFKRRISQETRALLRTDASKNVGMASLKERNPAKYQKKKDYMKNRKQNKKGKKRAAMEEEFSDDNSERYGKQHRNEEPTFGEQVERPPSFDALPRGATKKEESVPNSSLITGINRIMETEEKIANRKLKEKLERRYAQIKAQRKSKGDFHL
mmetsp:Transcript_59474/g.71495  ORF Transcript_59474/g.71495 Transcript_59474/m.71495 type:complete len:344 (+) Transcript_59474:153-1184(+)